MAIAESALRNFGIKGLQRSGFRGGSLLGSAVGTAIGIGFGLFQDNAASFIPRSTKGGYRKPNVGIQLDGS